MRDDLIKRLREWRVMNEWVSQTESLLVESADALDAQARRIGELTDALAEAHRVLHEIHGDPDYRIALSAERATEEGT
jgi:hypothetical protein